MPSVPSVLIVDDTPANLKLLGEILSRSGYEIQIATNGVDALKVASISQPQLILLDVVLPGMDGFEVCRELKQDPRLQKIPVIFISALGQTDQKIQGFRAGAVDYITKPFQADEVVARVSTHIRLSRMDDLVAEIAERKRSEAALRASEAALRQAQSVAHVGSWSWDIRANRIEWSDEMYRIFGLDRDALSRELAHLVRHAVVPEDQSKIEASEEVVRLGGVPQAIEFRIVRPNGAVRVVWAEAGELVRDGEGKPLSLSGIAQDITERRTAELALIASEERYRSLLQSAMDGFWVTDLDGQLLEVSNTYCRMCGYAAHELQGRVISDFDASGPINVILSHIRGAPKSREARFEARHLRKDGSCFDAEISAQFRDVDGGRCVGFIRDITQAKQELAHRAKLESELNQAQKMECVGQLAGGVAHDFNNMLSVILSYTSLVLSQLPFDATVREDVFQIKGAAERAASLTRQLLAFSRKQVLELRVIDPNQIVLGLEKMLRRVVGEDIELVHECCYDIGHIKADPGQLEQVITNLVVNARDAMPMGGKLTLRTQVVELDGAQVTPDAALGRSRYVELSVTDTGMGMDDSTMARIFEPFFTTKEKGKGTGLGLSTVYGIIKQCGGDVRVQSRVGQGTRMRVLFPQVEEELSVSSGPESEALPSGTETILVVEDNEAMLRAIERILSGAGYRVLPSVSAATALAASEGYEGEIDLLLSDVVMPKMNGPALASRLKERRPNTRIIYMSGYADDTIAHHGISNGDAGFIGKPFSPADLLRTVRAAFATVGAPGQH